MGKRITLSKSRIILACGLAGLAAAAAAVIAGPILFSGGDQADLRPARLMGPDAATAHLTRAGYDVGRIDRQGSLYEATLTSGARVYLDAATGEVMQPPASTGPALSVDRVRAQLVKVGWRDIGPVLWQEGGYRVEAIDSNGARFELLLDTYNGDILGREAR